MVEGWEQLQVETDLWPVANEGREVPFRVALPQLLGKVEELRKMTALNQEHTFGRAGLCL